MHDYPVPACAQRVSEGLASLQSEIEAALAALSKDNIRSFEESVSRQDCICQQLKDLSVLGSVGSSPVFLRGNATSACKELRQLLLVYAAVMRRITRSVEVLGALHKSAKFGLDARHSSKISFEI